jgi:hypothetical protein
VQIPRFLIERLYVRGSLMWLPQGERLSFEVRSGMLSGHLIGLTQVCIDDWCQQAHALALKLNDTPINMGSLSAEEPLFVPANSLLHISALTPGMDFRPRLRHEQPVKLAVGVNSRELGVIHISVDDHLHVAASS